MAYRYQIVGARRDTAEPVVLELYAENGEDAQRLANLAGVLATDVRPIASPLAQQEIAEALRPLNNDFFRNPRASITWGIFWAYVALVIATFVLWIGLAMLAGLIGVAVPRLLR